jgi:hypothetical protein
MHNLPVAVAEEDIADMFSVADSDRDGRISFREFQKMVNPPKPPEGPKPTKDDLAKRFSQLSPEEDVWIEEVAAGPEVLVEETEGTGEESVAATAGGLSSAGGGVYVALLGRGAGDQV